MDIKEGYVICSNRKKESIITNMKDFKNYIFMSEESLIKKVFGEIKASAVFELMKEYNLSYELAMEYIRYIPYANKDFYNNIKLDSIVSARNLLIKNGYFNKDYLFSYRLTQYPISILEFNNQKLLKSIIEYLEQYTTVTLIESNKESYKPIAYSFKDSYQEALFVMNEITKLYNKGISLNNIYILNINEEYEYIFKRLSKSFNIPIQFSNEKNILSFDIARKFLDLCKIKGDFNAILEELDHNSEIFNSIMNIIIDYDLEDENPLDYINFFKNKFKNIPLKSIRYDEMVKTTGSSFLNDEFVFYIGCNLGDTPKVYKDEEYLNDDELDLLGLPNSLDKNKYSKDQIVELFTYTKNLIVTYRERSGKDICFPSNILSQLRINVLFSNIEYGYSKLEDNIRLGLSYTKYMKYKTISEDLKYSINELRFNSYDNSFKGISKELLKEKFDDKPLKLAYSNLKTYYSCPFNYYLDKILELNEYESTISTRLGSFSHKVLEDSYSIDFNFNESVTNAMIEFADTEDEYKDYFYFNQMKSVLAHLIDYNKVHEAKSKLNMVERELFMTYQGDEYSFIGFVDKLMYTEVDNEIYAAIIDYKTGKDVISLDNVEDGYNLQLPCYMFLLSNYEKFKGKKIHIIGIYLQKVNIIALDNTIDIVAQREKSFKLKGYSTTDLGALSLLDPDYAYSDYIQSMGLKKDGSFNNYAKVISEDDSDKLVELTRELIVKANSGIKNGDFSISPKRIDGSDKSCTFCKYKDICFKKYENGVDLEKKPFLDKEVA